MALYVPRVLGPKIGWIRWPAFTADRNTFIADFLGSPPGVTANRVFNQFGNRAPSAWDNYAQWGPGISNAQGQAIVDRELISVKGDRYTRAGALDFFSYNWFPPPSCFLLDPLAKPKQSDIMLPFEWHRTSAYAANAAYTVMINPDWFSYGNTLPLPGDWSRAPQYRAHLAACMAESNFFRFEGRAVIGVYGFKTSSAPVQAEFMNQLDLLAAERGEPLWLIMQDHSITGGQDLLSRGARWLTTYGPNPGPGSVVANTQYPFSKQAAADIVQTGWIGSGLQYYASITPFNDQRPRNTSAWWIDQPTMPELVEHYSALFRYTQSGFGTATPELMMGYSWDEIDEGGPGFAPTAQEKTRYRDASLWVRTGIFPESYLYTLDARQKNFVDSGAWTLSAQTPGMFNNDDKVSTAAGDFCDFSHVRALQLGIRCSKGPNLGIGEVRINGAHAGEIDQYSPTPLYNQLGFMSARLNGGTNSIRLLDTNSRNPASSGNRVSYDACDIVYKP